MPTDPARAAAAEPSPATEKSVAPLTTDHLVPLPRRPLTPDGPRAHDGRSDSFAPDRGLRGWYENELGWETVPGEPVRLFTGRCFDVLDVPAEAGFAALGRLSASSPVALRGDRMWLLVAAGGAEEVPGILAWLEWGTLPLDLAATGAGGAIEAPRLPGASGVGAEVQGAAVWLRPPVAGREVASSLPAMPSLSAMPAPGGGGGAPDLVRLVDTVATWCHRVRLRHASAQPMAFS